MTDRHLDSYLVCLEDWSDEMKEAGDRKAQWYRQAVDWGLRVKLAVDEDDRPIGMIQYLPIEHGPAIGEGLHLILCIWVHGWHEGVGDHQGGGVGLALLEAAEADARRLGATGMAAWGLRLPIWMRSGWFKQHGYRPADRQGMRELVWKPFLADAHPPRWIPERPVAVGEGETVEVIGFNSGWCPAANLVLERARRASEELGTEVHFSIVDTADRESMIRCGRSDEVLVDGRVLQRGAPPSYRAVKRRIARQIRRRRRAAR